MKAPSVASAVKSTTLTAPSSAAPPMTPLAVILKPPPLASPPVAPTMSASALFTLAKTPIASSARYSTAVATIATTKSTNDTANENFMTDHGSMRLRCSRARRGPRGAPGAPALAVRMASETRAVAAVPPGRTGAVAMPAVRMLAVGGRTLARATAGPGTTGAVALTTGGALGGGALGDAAGAVGESAGPGFACVSVIG